VSKAGARNRDNNDSCLTMWKDCSPIFSCRKVAADVMQSMQKDEGKEIFDKSLHLYNTAGGGLGGKKGFRGQL